MTYKQAANLFKKEYGKTIKTCWIADVLRSHGKTKHKAWNRIGNDPIYPCPPEVRSRLEIILRELRMI